MARIRYLKPDFFKDEDIAELSFQTRLFYAGLWGQADKKGRLEDRPKRLKVEIMPYDNVDIEKMLRELATPKKISNRPFIKRYEVKGERYIQILAWERHQKPHHTERESEIPPLNGEGNGDFKGEGEGNGNGDGKPAQRKLELSNGELTDKELLDLKKKDFKKYLAYINKKYANE